MLNYFHTSFCVGSRPQGQRGKDVNEGIISMFKKIVLLFGFYFYLSSSVAAISGIWSDDTNSYWMFYEDQRSHFVLALHFDQSLTEMLVLTGNIVNDSSLALQTVRGESATLTANVAQKTFSGRFSTVEGNQDINANLVIERNPSELDGLWLSDINHYQLLMTINSSVDEALTAPTIIVDINNDFTTFNIYFGNNGTTQFSGANIQSASDLLTISFITSIKGEGSYISAGGPIGSNRSDFTLDKIL